MRKVNYSIFLGVIVLILLIIAIFILLPYINRSNYSYVGINFAEALIHNNSKLAYRLSDPSQWERIGDWLENHEAIVCPFSLDFDESMRISAGSKAPGEENAVISYFQICYTNGVYEFEVKIEEIILQRKNNQWFVADWSEVQEIKE